MRFITDTRRRKRWRSTSGTGSGAIAAALLLAVTLVAPAGASGTSGEKMLDARSISDAVEDELTIDPAVRSSLVDVTTVDGVVTLEGTVDNLLAKQRAERIAETVRGVRAVVNRIRVQPAIQRSDEELADDIRNALLLDPATESYEVRVRVDDGMVTLTGNVDSWQESQLVGKVAAGVRGVKSLENEIAITTPETRADLELKTEIEQVLRWDVLVDHALIDVSVENGQVTLDGTAGSAAEKRRAITDAWVPGVESVDASGLDVALWARDDALRENKYAERSDSEVREAVLDAMRLDPRVLSFEIDPEVEGGTVTLRGTVDNLKARRAAAADAGNTVGVLNVVNRVKVRPTGSIDASQAERSIRSALLRDPYVDRFDISVDVVNGVAFLSGDVDSFFEKAKAGDLASRAQGVVEVVNNLSVDRDERPMLFDPYLDDDWYVYDPGWYDYTPPTYAWVRDDVIRREIESELWWSPFVDSDSIDVTVVDGTARLTGTVETWAERRAATENAFEGGALRVENELQVF